MDCKKNWISDRQVEVIFSKLTYSSCESRTISGRSKTLDAARMKELEPHKRYTLAISLLHVQHAKTIDDIGTMYIKRVAKAENKAERAFHILKRKRENKQTNSLLHYVIPSPLIN